MNYNFLYSQGFFMSLQLFSGLEELDLLLQSWFLLSVKQKSLQRVSKFSKLLKPNSVFRQSWQLWSQEFPVCICWRSRTGGQDI